MAGRGAGDDVDLPLLMQNYEALHKFPVVAWLWHRFSRYNSKEVDMVLSAADRCYSLTTTLSAGAMYPDIMFRVVTHHNTLSDRWVSSET
jgi:hypothetical protein